ncbi:hypothetical protein D1872_346270 [compost metagenome]
MDGVNVILARFTERVIDVGRHAGSIKLFDVVVGVDISHFETTPQHVDAGG